MIPLIIDDKVRKDIERVKENAKRNPFSLETMQNLVNGEAAPGGDNPDFVVNIPVAFRVVYTYEEQPGNVICRHLSMSLSASGRVPNPLAVEMVMVEFGFVNKRIKDMIWWRERIGDDDDDSLTAINVIEPLDGDYTCLQRKH